MAELEYYRSGTAKYTQSAIKQKAPLMYTTNRPERCTQDPENRKSFLAIKAAPYPYELTHLPTRRTLSELRAPTRTHLYSFPCVTHIIY